MEGRGVWVKKDIGCAADSSRCCCAVGGRPSVIHDSVCMQLKGSAMTRTILSFSLRMTSSHFSFAAESEVSRLSFSAVNPICRETDANRPPRMCTLLHACHLVLHSSP